MEKSQFAEALEAEVRAIRELRDAAGRAGSGSASNSLRIDRHYAKLFVLLEPRMMHLTRRYGLGGMAEDARQACTIGIYRAVCDWDSGRASFATLAHWQMRGELQSLRHRMMLDQRQSARSAGIRTVGMTREDGSDRAEVLALSDEDALASAQADASDAMARDCFEVLWSRLVGQKLQGRTPPTFEKRILENHFFAGDAWTLPPGMSAEQCRQVTRRLTRHMQAVAG